MNLPIEFINQMKSLLGEDYIYYEQSLESVSRMGIRANRLKVSRDKLKSLLGDELVDIPFIENGLFIEEKDKYTKNPYYYAGLYYVQEPSAMTPASMLEINEDDKVLDLCAAPGGKTTELLAKRPAFLLANDISYSRTIPLIKNIELFGATNYCVTAETPEKLSTVYPEYFDKILVDAPCSGEGMFRKDHSLIQSWLDHGPDYYKDIQYDILSSAIKMLRPGGDLIYSTCTFSQLEDEETIGRILSEYSDIKISPLKHYDGFCNGFKIQSYPDIDFSDCIRLFPHKMEGEGHFIVKLHKDIESNSDASFDSHTGSNALKLIQHNKLPEDIKEFLKHINVSMDKYRFYINNDNVYLLDENVIKSIRKGLRYVRTGQLIGTLKNGKYFSPNSGYALSLSIENFDNTLDLSDKDERCIKYLKGETIFAKEEDSKTKKGYVLICVNGYPLGFSKYDGSKYKNLYNPGWRYNG